MKKLLILFLFLNIYALKAQDNQAYAVTYKYVPSGNARKLQLVFNDSVSYWFVEHKRFTPKRKNKDIYGEVNIHHSNFFFKKNNKMYSMMSMDKHHPYMFTVEPPVHLWIANSDTKLIEGYACKSALRIDNNGDSVLVYYTEDIPCVAGPLWNYSGVPGVVLEIFDQSCSLHLIATQVREGNFTIMFPNGMEIVSQEERNRRVAIERMKSNYPL